MPSLYSRLWAQLPPHGIDSHSRLRARDRRDKREARDRQKRAWLSTLPPHPALLAFHACPALLARPAWSLYHKIHQFFFDIHNLLRLFALQPFRDLRTSQPFDLLACGVGSHVEFGSQLSIHLDRNSQPVACCHSRVIDRPGLLSDARLVTQHLPQLFCQMGREGCQDQDEWFEYGPGALLGLRHLIRKYHHLGDRGIEPQRFDTLR